MMFERAPDWAGLEKHFAEMATPPDSAPTNVREWSNFRDVYESCEAWHRGSMPDPSREGINENEHGKMIKDHLYCGHGYKKSPIELFSDYYTYIMLIQNEYGLDLYACKRISDIWHGFINNMNYDVLPRCLGHYGGNFNCSGNRLTNLEGAPSKVSGDFFCTGNRLTNLAGAPDEVEGDFYCYDNQLTSLEGAPSEVGCSFNCSNNRLTSLAGAPDKVGGDFSCYNNPLTSLAGAPSKVGGDKLWSFGLNEREVKSVKYIEFDATIMRFDEFAKMNERAELSDIENYVLFSHTGSKEIQLTVVDPDTQGIVGNIELSKDFGQWHVDGVAAEKGFGPLMYEMAMMTVYPLWVKPSLGSTSPAAQAVWDKFHGGKDVERRHDAVAFRMKPTQEFDIVEKRSLDPDSRYLLRKKTGAYFTGKMSGRH